VYSANASAHHREPQSELVDVVARQACAKQDERQKKDAAAQADQLDERVLPQHREEHDGPRNQDDQPVPNVLGP